MNTEASSEQVMLSGRSRGVQVRPGAQTSRDTTYHLRRPTIGVRHQTGCSERSQAHLEHCLQLRMHYAVRREAQHVEQRLHAVVVGRRGVVIQRHQMTTATTEEPRAAEDLRGLRAFDPATSSATHFLSNTHTHTHGGH